VDLEAAGPVELPGKAGGGGRYRGGGGGSGEDGRRRLDRGREERKVWKGGNEGFGVETPIGFGPDAGPAGGISGRSQPCPHEKLDFELLMWAG
jgi:hypothetical protein